MRRAYFVACMSIAGTDDTVRRSFTIFPCVATLDVRQAARRQDLGTACPRSPLCNADVSPAGIRILVLLSPPPRSRRGHPCRVVRAFVLVRDHFIWLASPRGLSYLVPFISQRRAKRLIYAETR